MQPQEQERDEYAHVKPREMDPNPVLLLGVLDQPVTCIKKPGVTVVVFVFKPQIADGVFATHADEAPDNSEGGLLARVVANKVAVAHIDEIESVESHLTSNPRSPRTTAVVRREVCQCSARPFGHFCAPAAGLARCPIPRIAGASGPRAGRRGEHRSGQSGMARRGLLAVRTGTPGGTGVRRGWR